MVARPGILCRLAIPVALRRASATAPEAGCRVDRERMICADYHAVYRGEGEDLWRIGDRGALDVDDFRVVFLLQRGSFYALGVAWAGEEGLNLSVFVSNDDDHFDRVIADYWYREPV